MNLSLSTFRDSGREDIGQDKDGRTVGVQRDQLLGQTLPRERHQII